MKNKKIKLIKYTSKFKRQYKKFKKRHYNVDNILYAIDAIVNYDDIKLRRMKDHILKGE